MPQTPLGKVLENLRRAWAAHEIRDLTDGDLLRRFHSGGEDAAFAVLVQRHGPMVLGVCQRVLVELHDAEDAFQATFLVLIRRAGSISKSQPLGGWLYAVARRIAMKARARATSRRDREMRFMTDVPRTDPLDEAAWQELRSILDEEIGRLPAKYRTPIVLGYLQGKTHEQAAAELGWPKRSLTNRLARGKELLRRQLTRRGICLSAGVLTTVLAEKAAAAPVATLLTLNTVKAVTSVAAGKLAAGGLVSARAVTLAEEAMKGMLTIKTKLVLLVLVCCLAAGGVGLAARGVQEEKAQLANPEPARAQAVPPAQKQENEAEMLFRAMEKMLVEAKSLKVVWEIQSEVEDEAGKAVPVKFQGSCFFAAGDKDKIYIWDVTTGKQLHLFSGKQADFSPLAFSPDGKLLACEGEDKTIRLWDVSTGKEHRHWESHQNTGLRSLMFSPDGKVLASAGVLDSRSDGGVHLRLWAVDTGKAVPLPIEFRDDPYESRVQVLAISPSGRVLATTPSEARRDAKTGKVEAMGIIWLWDLLSCQALGFIDTPQETIDSLAFAPDGRTLASGGGDSTILLWDLTGLNKDTNSKQAQLTAAELDDLWNDLGANAAKADRAIWTLAAAPKQSVPLLSQHLRPAAPADARQVAKLIADLDNQNFAARQQAEKELVELGERAEAAMRMALDSVPNLEVRQRLEKILEKSNDAKEVIRRLRAIEALEHAGTSEARQAIELLAEQAPNPRVKQAAAAALRRMAKT